MEPDHLSLRDCFGRFPTGVTIVTYEADGNRRGATVNSFMSVSLEPPLVLVGINRRARAGEALPTRPFTVNVLSTDQSDHALHFSGREQPGLTLGWEPGRGSPRLVDCVAYVACEPWATYPAGDHLLVIGRVTDLEIRDLDPLLFYNGGFRSFDRPLVESERTADRTRSIADDAPPTASRPTSSPVGSGARR